MLVTKLLISVSSVTAQKVKDTCSKCDQIFSIVFLCSPSCFGTKIYVFETLFAFYLPTRFRVFIVRELHSEPFQTCKMKRFGKIANHY